MFAHALSAVILGMEALPVVVEADMSDGLPSFIMVGSPTAQLKEAQDRVRTALKNNGINLPPRRITVNFTPADVRKEGAGFDLPVAAAVLGACGILTPAQLEGVMIMGELSLNGEILAAKGVLPRVFQARAQGCRFCLLPAQNLEEALLVPDMPVIGAGHLIDMLEALKNPAKWIRQREKKDPPSSSHAKGLDFADIFGQEMAKRAAEIAASGFHNLLLIGPPGSGKTMIARRLPTILPDMTFEECLEVTKIYSIAGLLSKQEPLISSRPFRSPHHTTSPQALSGGGRIPTPGEITLSHRGILFLDEFAEFGKNTLECLRQPLEDKVVHVSRVSGTYDFPADFMLVAAMNPCPCGYYPDMRRCRCTMGQVNHYLGKLSQPLLDRLDMCVDVETLPFLDMQGERSGDSSAQIRKRVERARQIQAKRYEGETFRFNGQLPGNRVEEFCQLTPKAKLLLRKAYEGRSFSARTYHRLLKVSRTIADMEACPQIHEGHVGEALGYHAFEGKYL